jgi:hypothetical protein
MSSKYEFERVPVPDGEGHSAVWWRYLGVGEGGFPALTQDRELMVSCCGSTPMLGWCNNMRNKSWCIQAHEPIFGDNVGDILMAAGWCRL